jgi:hypothetical protein
VVKLKIATILLALGAPVCANDQDVLTGIQSNYYVTTASGQDVMCGFDFTLVYKDRSYKQGAFAVLRGSLSWIENHGNLAVMVKAVGADPAGEDFSQGIVPFKIAGAFLAADGKASMPTQSPCEDSRYFCGTYGLPSSLLLYRSLEEGNLSIAFSRLPGGFDIKLPLNPKGPDADNSQRPDFTRCMSGMFDRAIEGLRPGR